MFWSVYMSGAVRSSLFVSCRCWVTSVRTSSSKCLASTQVRVTRDGMDPLQSSFSSWEVHFLPFCYLAVSIFGSVILFGLKPAVDENGNEKAIHCPRRNVKEEVVSDSKDGGYPQDDSPHSPLLVSWVSVHFCEQHVQPSGAEYCQHLLVYDRVYDCRNVRRFRSRSSH